jgi:hypothetical protein
MPKVTSERIAAIKENFEHGEVITQDNLADLIDAFAEAAEAHEHKPSGGDGTGTGDAGPVGNLKSGPAASKPENPAVGDIYIATDTGHVYCCHVTSFWSAKATRLINRQMGPDDWYFWITKIRSGLDANKPASPVVGDAYIATDTGQVYFCHTALMWSTKAARLINRQMMPDTWPRDIPNLRSGMDANKPASPIAGDVYIATDTGKVYYCFSIGEWSHLLSIFNLQAGLDANRPESPLAGDIYLAIDTGKAYFCFSAGLWSTKGSRLINSQMAPLNYPPQTHAPSHASDGVDDLTDQDIAMASLRLVPRAGISADDEGWLWWDNTKVGFHQLRGRNATHKTRLDPGAAILNRQFLITYP